MYAHDQVYRSIVHFVSQIVPSGVTVVDGESYGIRLEDPSGKSTSVAVTVEDRTQTALELGSFATEYSCVFTINATSRIQRDALTTIVYSGLLFNDIPVYAEFTDFVPSGDIQRYLSAGDYISAKSMPDFSTNRDRFFWVAVVFCSLETLGL